MTQVAPARVEELARTRELREVKLSAPVMAWLRARGLRPYAECPNWDSPIDVVGVGDSLVVAVELKMCLSQEALRKALCNQVSANESWCGVASQPRATTLAKCKRWGVGVLRITGDTVTVLVDAVADMFKPMQARLDRTRGWAAEIGETGDGGLPNLAGEGPAQDCERRVDEYMVSQPKAQWAEVFANVPNHYANPRSMGSAMAKVYARRARKEWRREHPVTETS